MLLAISTACLVALLFLILGPARWIVSIGLSFLSYAYPLTLVAILLLIGAVYRFTHKGNNHDLPRLPDRRD